MKWKPMRWKPLGWFLGEVAKSVTENLKRGNFNEDKVLATDLGLQLSDLPGIIARQVGPRGLWNQKGLRLPPSELKPSFHAYGRTNRSLRTHTQQQQKRKKVSCLSHFGCFRHWLSLLDFSAEPIWQHSVVCRSHKPTVFPRGTTPPNS